ncbi:calcium-binding protein, partial [Paraburkholderia sp. BR10954]|uniref:calcium-binding protein n=1 Tax=Paraburkholderia sp. BR10954 TaxID=3236995 RepID=UPI0034D3047B
IVQVRATGRQIRIVNHFSASDGTSGLAGLTFADGTTMPLGELAMLGGTGGDLLTGAATDDLLLGQDGDVRLSGGGNDTILGYAGNDTLIGGTGSDSIDGGTGDDLIDGRDDPGTDGASDVIQGRDGNDT